jgi:hypothetical protein
MPSRLKDTRVGEGPNGLPRIPEATLGGLWPQARPRAQGRSRSPTGSASDNDALVYSCGPGWMCRLRAPGPGATTARYRACAEGHTGYGLQQSDPGGAQVVPRFVETVTARFAAGVPLAGALLARALRRRVDAGDAVIGYVLGPFGPRPVPLVVLGEWVSEPARRDARERRAPRAGRWSC